MDDKMKVFMSQFTDSELDDVVRVGRSYYHASPELLAVKDSIKRDVYSLGIFLGEERRGFEPSPAFIDIISRMPGAEKRKIFVNKKAEWLFLCGRSILQESIARNPNNISEGSVLVQNENDENLGYGYFKQEGKDLVVRNLLDKGSYLRIEDKKGRKGR